MVRSPQMAYDRRLHSQNIVHLLQNRESGYKRNGSKCSRDAALAFEREFYKSYTPCLTVQYIDIPPVYLRKFTPDGSKLLAFAHDQRSLHVFTYKGVGAAASLLSEANVGARECISGSSLRSKLFHKLFETKFLIRLCQGDFARHHLHREFSIFLENGRYVLLAGMCVHNGALGPNDYVRNPDLFDKLDPFSYMFFVVDLELGQVTDEVCLPHDAICMSHNHGVSVYGRTIAMLSRLYQCVYLFELVNGKLIRQETIGQRPRDYTSTEQPDKVIFDLNTKLAITHIKQRVLSFLYRQIEYNSQLTQQQKCAEYQEFYKSFDFLEHMIVEKIQLVNSDLLFLRYEERPKTTSDVPNITAQGETQPPRRLYVFYSITSENVLGVYQDDSVDLLKIILLFNDKLCNVRSMQTGDVPSCPTHQFIQQNFINPIKPPHILRQAALRLNPSAPVSTQSYTASPYLNYNVLNYDDRKISPLERPKLCATEPIVFRDRASDLVKFRLNAKARMPRADPAPNELCAFIFHPYEPLVLSIQKCIHSYAFNVHIYNQSTVVKQQ